ncbi:MAG TPA: DUF4159 domain-containing protein [Tepidisphaeraceae bacterium]|jgi:hypothetical protein
MVVATGPAPAAAPTPFVAPDAAAIADSIDKGKAYLYSIQNPDGTWEDEAKPPDMPKDNKDGKATADESQWGGRTALAVYTMLTLGDRATDEKLKKAIAFLHTSPDITSTYGLALKCHVWSSLPQTAEVKKSLRRDASMLVSYRKVTGQNYTVWDYTGPDAIRAKNYSLMSLQTAGWGLAAAADADYEVAPDVWKGIERTLLASQTAEGGWYYHFAADEPKSTFAKPLSMYATAGNGAVLQIAQDFTRTDSGARGNVSTPAMEKVAAWMAKNFDPPDTGAGGYSENMNRRLYGIELFSLATGLRRFGEHDWYAKGSEFFVRQQAKKAGSWGVTSRAGTDYRLIDTCWALLYLQQGRVPVALAKLDYSAASENPKQATWNQRPRDAANLVRWIGRATERELRWQIVTPTDSLDALLEAPVLYLAGGDALTLKADAKAKLKAYVEHGGLILAVADGGVPAFSKSVERLALELFPGNEWRDLNDAHPIFANQMYKRNAFKSRPLVRAISNGVRELFVLIPAGDPAKTWQVRGGRTTPDAWQLAANVVSYAVDKSRYFARGTTWLTPPSVVTPKNKMTIGRLKYAGPWDPEPAAWPQFTRHALARDWAVTVRPIEAGKAIDGVDVLHVTGTTAFTFDEPTRTALKTYLDAGGRVIFEAAGGSAAFAASAQAELTRWYGADAVVSLPPTHKLYGEKLAVSFRGFNLASIENPTQPQFRAVEKDGRVVALLSREDLSAGLLGVPTDGITGYSPESARAVLLRVMTKWK